MQHSHQHLYSNGILDFFSFVCSFVHSRRKLHLRVTFWVRLFLYIFLRCSRNERGRMNPFYSILIFLKINVFDLFLVVSKAHDLTRNYNNWAREHLEHFLSVCLCVFCGLTNKLTFSLATDARPKKAVNINVVCDRIYWVGFLLVSCRRSVNGKWIHWIYYDVVKISSTLLQSKVERFRCDALLFERKWILFKSNSDFTSILNNFTERESDFE